MSRDSLRLSLKEISEAKFFSNNKKLPEEVGSINELSEKDFRKGLMNCVFSGRKSIPPDIVKMPPTAFDGYVSSYAVEDGVVRGLFLIKKNPADELEIVLLQSVGKDANRCLTSMVKDAFLTAINLYPDTMDVVIPLATPEAAALVKKLFPGRI